MILTPSEPIGSRPSPPARPPRPLPLRRRELVVVEHSYGYLVVQGPSFTTLAELRRYAERCGAHIVWSV